MCGICASLKPTNQDGVSSLEMRAHIASRGPDHHGSMQIPVHDGLYTLELSAAVLFLRGHPTMQPAIDESGDVLLWNGEVWGGLEVPDNDTAAVLALLSHTTSPEEVVAAMSTVQGEWAFVYWQASTGTLFWGRDCLGRRSLLTKATDGGIALCSVPLGTTADWCEVPNSGVFSIRVPADGPMPELPIVEHAWAAQKVVATVPEAPAEAQLPEAALMEEFAAVLGRSVAKRVSNIWRPPPGAEGGADAGERDAVVAVLFSGGLDCIVLAALANTALPSDEPIDLVNVGFARQLPVVAPDRDTARAGVEELRAIAPNRKWRLIEVDVVTEEFAAAKDEITTLIYPRDTVMDLTIGGPLWFASRGRGVCAGADGVRRPCTCSARVLLSGLGADELLAGYGRHRVRFEHNGWQALHDELELDFSRLWSRNLGRDDRVISAHAREARYPYLDEEVVAFLRGLPVWQKADMRLPAGTGDKMLLRAVASSLGLTASAALAKRAIQFGSRINKLFAKKLDGTDSAADVVLACGAPVQPTQKSKPKPAKQGKQAGKRAPKGKQAEGQTDQAAEACESCQAQKPNT